MKAILIFATFIALCFAVDVSVNSRADLVTQLVTSVNAGSTIKLIISGTFDVSELISNTGLNSKEISLTGSAQITSLVTTGPLFKLGGTNLDLTFTGISLTDSTGTGLIDFTGRKLTIDSGTYTGQLSTVSVPIIKTTSATVIICSESTAPSFNAYRVFDITGGSLDFKDGSFATSGTKGTQIKATNADPVTIGDEDDGSNLLIDQLTFGQLSSAVVLESCKTVVIQQVTFDKLQTINNADQIYQTPALVVYASTTTSLTIKDCKFTNNNYRGLELASGAIYIQFPRVARASSSATVEIKDTQFISNAGTSSGAITFLNKGVQTIRFTNVDFASHSIFGQNDLIKASSIFATDDLSEPLGANPFSTCYAVYDSRDYPYGNDVPFYLSLESRAVSPYLQDKQKTVYVQDGYVGPDTNIFATFQDAYDSTISNCQIIMKGSQFTITSDYLSLLCIRPITITHQEATNPTIYNQIASSSLDSYAFQVQRSLTMSKFNIVHGDDTVPGYATSTCRFFRVIFGGILRISDIQFTTNLETNYRTQSFIYVNSGSLYVDGCSFSGQGFASSQCAVEIGFPSTIEIKESTFVGNTADFSSGAAVLTFTYVGSSAKIAITNNTFINNGPYSTGNVLAGALYFNISLVTYFPNSLVNLQRNIFTNNVGTGAGAVYITYPNVISTDQLSLVGSTFSGNVIDVLRSTNYAYLYESNDQTLEVSSDSSAIEANGNFTLNYISTNPTAYRLKSIQAALTFSSKFNSQNFNQITVIGEVTNVATNPIEANFVIQGRKSETDASTGTLQIGNAGQLTFSNSGNELRWLNLVRTATSTATNLVEVTSGDLTVDGCSFSDSKTAELSFSYILVSSSYTTTIRNSAFNGAKFVAGAAISKTDGTLSIEKCTFNGNAGQTGPFLSLSGSGIGTNTIKQSVFKDAGTSAVIINTGVETNFNYNVFTELTKGPAIQITSQSYQVELFTNQFINNGDIVSSSSGAISIDSTDPQGTLTVRYNQFTNNKGSNAGAIYSVQSTNTPSFLVKYNFFSENTGSVKDIYIKGGNINNVDSNIRSGGSPDDAKYGTIPSTIANAYITPYTYRSEVHVRPIGVDGISSRNIDEGDGTGAIDKPLKSLVFAVNSKTAGNLDVVLYRLTYSISDSLLILDDTVTISDSDECSSPYFTSDKSTITGIISQSAFFIKSGSLVLNAINVDITGTTNPFSLISITAAGSFEANRATIQISVNYQCGANLIESSQAIKSFKLINTEIYTQIGNPYPNLPLIDLTLNSESTFSISDTTFKAPEPDYSDESYLRYATIKVESKPAVFLFSHVTFDYLSTDITAKIVQIIGAAIDPYEVFSRCTVSATTAPLLKIPGESYSGQYDGVLLTSAQNSLGQFDSLYELQNPQTIDYQITYVGSRYVIQSELNGQLIVQSGGHLTVRGVTFIQQPRGNSVIYASSGDAVIVLEGVGFLVASQEQIATGLGFLHSSDLREDLESINKKRQKINIDYYLKSLQKTSHSQILTKPFIDIYRGYSLTLSSIRFGDWIATDYIPLIRSVGAIQHALIENIKVNRVGRQYGGPHILDLNLRPSGEVVIRNVTIDGRGWVHNTKQPVSNQQSYYFTPKNLGKCITGQTEFEKIPIDPDVKLDVQFPGEFYWEYPAIYVTGGKLRMSDTTFIGLGVDGALVLENVEADIANSTRFEENDVYRAAKAEGRKKLIPSEIESVSDEEDSDNEYDETDRRIRELRRYPEYIKNVIAKGKTTLRGWNVSFIGEKLAKKKTAYKAGYPLWIQHEREVQLVGEVGQSNNAFGVPDVKYVKSSYVVGSDKDLGNGKIEKTVETEIRTKGLLIPGVEWFLEMKNKKDPEENQRLYHYNLLHRKVWEEATKEQKLLGWYISEDENLLKEEKKSATSNSYYESQFGGKVLVRWVSQSVILLRFAHIEPKPEEKANADEAPADPDADRYVKDWEFRLGVEKRADQETIDPDLEVKWTNLKKIPFPVWAIVLIVVLVVLLIAAIIVAIILFFVCRKQKVGSSDGVEMNPSK